MPAASPDPSAATVAVLLAAGAGSRFAGRSHKLLAEVPASNGRPVETVFARAAAVARQAAIGPLVVVGGAVGTEALAPLLDAHDEMGSPTAAHVSDAVGVELVDNPRWADGQITSVRLGLETARSMGAHRVVIGLADQPGITVDAWRSVAATEGSIVVATYDGRRGNPVALDSDIWNLLPDEGDEGARTVMRLRPELVVEVPCSGSPDDIDTTEDLRRWQNNSSTNSP